jgi:short-subunit dehydrogenase
MMNVVITGASTGIGKALALAWAREGGRVVLSARGESALREVAREVERRGGDPVVVPGDVTSRDHREELVARAVAGGRSLDVLVNNAGRGYYASFDRVDLDELRALFELNVVAPLALSQLAAPHLASAKGAIVMISSVAGVVAAPKYTAYSATKFALEAMSSAMRAELAERGVRVLVVRPGPVDTPFRRNAARGEGERGYDAPDPRAQSADEVAARTLRALRRRAHVDETSAFVRFASAVSRFSPATMRVALRRMARKTD